MVLVQTTLTGARLEIEKIDEGLKKLGDTASKVLTVTYGVIGILRHLGLPDEVDAAITKIQRLIAIANMLRATLLLLEAASGPWGWLLLGIAAAGTALTAADFVTEGECY